jgi:Domain of unknown function (DUF4267)
MSHALQIALTVMGIGRILIGVAPFIAAGAVSRLLGFPQQQDSPTARLMGRFFGVRDIGLGVLAFYAIKNPASLMFVLIFNACMDAGDLVSTSIPLIRRHGIDRAALSSAACALIGGLSWVATYAFFV